jgi:hypothetical protein
VPTAAALSREQAVADYLGLTDPGFVAALLPAAAVAELVEAQVPIADLLDPGLEGAFDPARPTSKRVTALIAVPASPATGSCPPGHAASRCAPLVVFHHGITRGKADLLGIAGTLTARGFIVAAIDMPKHGDRSFCASDADCATGDRCEPQPALASASDPVAPGLCKTTSGGEGRLARMAPKAVPRASGNFLVSLDLFRTRDTLRQDVIDHAFLTLALARPAALRAGYTPDALETYLAATHDLGVDPTRVYWASQSLGSVVGTLNLAANDRFSRAVLNTGGATLVDIFANPTSGYHDDLVALLATNDPPIQEDTAGYRQFLQVAKWILDPAEPANFAARVATPLLFQAAYCDGTIPNDQNELLAALLGATPPLPATTATTGRFQWFLGTASGDVGACPAPGAQPPPSAVSHGFLLASTSPVTIAAQSALADFLATGDAQPTPFRPAP